MSLAGELQQYDLTLIVTTKKCRKLPHALVREAGARTRSFLNPQKPMLKSPKPKSVAEYIAGAPPPARRMLRELRSTIRSAVPEVSERLSYGMPYYHYQGRIAYFAAFRNHVSFFVMPLARNYAPLKKQVGKYLTGRATMRFPIGTRIPLTLIRKLVLIQKRANTSRSLENRA